MTERADAAEPTSVPNPASTEADTAEISVADSSTPAEEAAADSAPEPSSEAADEQVVASTDHPEDAAADDVQAAADAPADLSTADAPDAAEADAAAPVAGDDETLTASADESAAPESTDEASGEPVAAVAEGSPGADAKQGPRQPRSGQAATVVAAPRQESAEVATLRTALAEKTPVEGKVFGWNEHGFHVSLVDGKIAAFCPRSEMEVKHAKEGSTYLDQTFQFRVLKVQRGGKRVVVSRAELLREQLAGELTELRREIEVGKKFQGTVSSLTDFGAFVDIGGIEGLVHVSEISHQRVSQPGEVLRVGQEVEVQVIKVEKGGKRISLSMKTLEADPWADVKARFPEGTKVKGTVERSARFGVIIQLEPGLSGLLPASEITLPPGSSFMRVYPTGREVEVLVGEIDSRRRRISLMLEGSRLEGSRTDFADYKRRETEGPSLGTMAAALSRLGLSDSKSE